MIWEILDIALRSIRIADPLEGQPTWNRTIEFTPAERVAGMMFNIIPGL